MDIIVIGTTPEITYDLSEENGIDFELIAELYVEQHTT